MYCLDCKKLINKKIVYHNIFKKNIYKICDNCLSKIIFLNKYEVLPIDNYLIHLNILVKDYTNSDSLSQFLKPYYIYYLKNKLKMLIVYFDNLSNEDYNVITKTNISDIYMIVLKK